MRHTRAHVVAARHAWIRRRLRRYWWVRELVEHTAVGDTSWWFPGRLAKWNTTCSCIHCRSPRYRQRRHLERAAWKRDMST